MYALIFKIFITFLFIKNANCDTCSDRHLGLCPQVEEVADFDMNKMLGTWYVIEKTCTTSQCMIYNISQTSTIGEYKIESISEDYWFGWSPIKKDSYSAATLKVEDQDHPSRMRIVYPFKIFGQTTFNIFSTDYTNYAGIFACQQTWSSNHKQSAAILSRKRTLDKSFIDKIRNKLFSSEINPFDLSIIKQENCTNSPGDSAWSSFRAEVVRRAGNTVTDGVDYISRTGRGSYNKVSDTIHRGVDNAGDRALQGVQNTVEAARGLGQKVYENVDEKVRRTGEKIRTYTRGKGENITSTYDDATNKSGNATDDGTRRFDNSVNGENYAENLGGKVRENLRETEERLRGNYGDIDRNLGRNVQDAQNKLQEAERQWLP